MAPALVQRLLPLLQPPLQQKNVVANASRRSTHDGTSGENHSGKLADSDPREQYKKDNHDKLNWKGSIKGNGRIPKEFDTEREGRLAGTNHNSSKDKQRQKKRRNAA
jgi:hypothetical protein